MVKGAPHTAKGSMINLCVLGCPLPPYIKEQGGGRPAQGGRARRRSPPLFLLLLGGERKGEREKERGRLITHKYRGSIVASFDK